MPPRVVLVTGVSRHLGSRLAGVLALDPSVERVVGVDTVAPRPEQLALLGRTEFVRADIRNPLIAKVIAQAGVDTVVHMNVVATPSGAGGRTAMKEINVIGTMQLLAACQKAPTMRKLVVKSTTAVYGSSPRDPALFTEDQEPRALPRSGYAKDAVEVEGYVRGFGRRRPDVALTVCRFTNFVGPTIDSPLTRYLSLPVVPTVLGFDPRLQLCHEDDGIEVLRRTTLEEHPGTYNVGGEGVLLLSQALRRLGRLSVPLPSVAGSAVARRPARRRGLLARAARLPRPRPGRRHPPPASRARHGAAADRRGVRGPRGAQPQRPADRRYRGGGGAARARRARATACRVPDRRGSRCLRPRSSRSAPAARAAAPAGPSRRRCRSPRPRRRTPRRTGSAASPAGSPSCAAASPATTRSTSSASTSTSPTTCCCRRCARCTAPGSGWRPAAWTTCPRPAARSSWPTTPARCRSTRS